jgi:hypothetical protein
MKVAWTGLILAPALMLASPAAAQATGAWRVSGAISGTAFALDCRFEPQGADFGGVCVEAATGDPKVHAGKSHTLTKGAVAGRQVSWTYPASFLMARFDVNFTGTLDGDHMAGTVTASGRKGEFTAVRK